MDSKACIISTTTDSEQSALELCKTMIEKKLAACAQIIPGVKSIYEWNEQVEISNELILQFKTTQVLAERLMMAIKDLHHYEVPELITVNTDLIDTHYYKWLKDVTGQDISL